MSTTVEKILSYIEYQAWKIADRKSLLGVSGGRDSMCLLHFYKNQGYEYQVAHVNYGLRGYESNAETQKLIEFCERHQIPLHILRVEDPQKLYDHASGVQEAAREIRYEFYTEIKNNQNLDYIVTAHHADDNVETLIMRLLDGAGLQGLGGIPPQMGKVIRPFLTLQEEDMSALVELWDVQYSVDSSNSSDKYFRNQIRHQILPILKLQFPDKYPNISAAIQHLDESHAIYRSALKRRIHKLITHRGGIDILSISALKSIPAHDTLLYECMKSYGVEAAQIPEINKLLDASTGRYIDTETHRILHNRGQILIAPLSTETPQVYTLKTPQAVDDPDFTLSLKVAARPKHPQKSKHYLAHHKINWPIILRPWQQGDYFYPEGLGKKKKLSDYFGDQKLSLYEKQKVRVLQDSLGHILAVLGYRADDRYVAKEGEESLAVLYKIKE